MRHLFHQASSSDRRGNGLGGAAEAAAAPRADAMRALWVLRFAFGSFCVAVWVGLPWDFYWHTSRLFENFFSPPHFVIYGGSASAVASLVYVVRSPSLAAPFGPTFRIPMLRIAPPRSLLLFGGGLVVIGLAGLVDGYWHTHWGTDETSWSLPHALLAWGIFLGYLGFLSARRALEPLLPISPAVRVGLAVLGFACSLVAIIGPFALNSTPHQVDGLFARPGFVAVVTQRLLVIITDFGLTRTNPAYPVLLAVWIGVGLRLAASLDPRPRFLLWVAAGATALYAAVALSLAIYLGTADDWAAWLPPAVLPAALVVLALSRLKVTEWVAWGVAGAVVGVLTTAVYPTDAVHAALALLAAPASVVGLAAGARLGKIVERPTPAALSVLLPGFGLVIPVVAGAVDLWMRTQGA